MSMLILPRTGLLAFMDDEYRSLLADYGQVWSTTPGEVIIRQDDVQERLYVILHGTYDVLTLSGSREVRLDSLGEGDCFGEMAIFNPAPASATVRSHEAGQLWYMEAAHVQQFLIDAPFAGCALLLGVNTLLSRRLKRANSVIKSNEIVPSFLSIRNRARPDKIAAG